MLRRRLGVASRACAALLGGYALASFLSVTLALGSRSPREEAIAGATPLAFLAFAGAVLWAFAARSAARAWLGIATPTVIFAALSCWLRAPSP